MCTKCFLKVSWKLEVASKRQFDLRVDNFHMIFSCFIFSFSIYILAVKPIKTGINPIWHGGPYDPPARKLAGLRFVSVFMSVCRYVCFSAQTMYLALIGWITMRVLLIGPLVQLLIGWKTRYIPVILVRIVDSSGPLITCRSCYYNYRFCCSLFYFFSPNKPNPCILSRIQNT